MQLNDTRLLLQACVPPVTCSFLFKRLASCLTAHERRIKFMK
jgi:hypothetical protein